MYHHQDKDVLHIYQVYHSAKDRCENTKSPVYKNYGSRGIKMIWNSFQDFSNDMLFLYKTHKSKYGKDTTLDRIDNNSHYSKENCR